MKKNLLSAILKNKLFLFLLLLSSGQSVYSAIIYVNGANTGNPRDGLSWATAYTDFKVAVDRATVGDQVWVARGTYAPATSWFTMKSGVKIYGGFLSGATSLSERDWKANETILTTRFNSIFENIDVDSTSRLDGFILRDAPVTAMTNLRSSPTLVNIDFINNQILSAYPYGGALRNVTNSNPSLTNVRFIGNRSLAATNISYGTGGAIYNYMNCTTTLTNVVFSENKSQSNTYTMGGAIYNEGNLILNNVVFDRNQCAVGSYLMGAAIYSSGGNVKMSNVVFTGNSAYYGSMIYGYNAAFEIVQTTGYKNANAGGGNYSGFSLAGTSSLKVVNSIFIANNYSSYPSTTHITNSFFDIDHPSGSANISATNLPFSNPDDPAGADGNWLTADDGLQISLGAKISPVDKGAALTTPAYSAVLVGNATKDILGVTRPKGAANDLGAYEKVVANQVFYVDATNENGVHDGSSWATAFNKLEDALLQAAAGTGNSVWVAKGTYVPPLNQSFTIGRTTTVYGGFTNTSTNFSQRDWKANTTILKGNGAGVIDNDFPDDAGNIIGLSLLNGFTITGGRNAKGGAGMYNKYASPDLKNIIFTDNQTTGSGGALYSEGSSSLLENVTFQDNTASADGGAVFTTTIANKLTYRDVVFINNSANRGGALGSIGNTANVDIENTVFQNNRAVYGGAAYSATSRTTNFTNVVFAGNTATYTATVHNAGSVYSSFLNVSFSKNTATDNILIAGEQVVSPITNGLFFGNSTGFTRTSFYSCYGQLGNVTSPFLSEDLPAGADGVWRTADDGLQLKYEAGTINRGQASLTDPNNMLSLSMQSAARQDILGTSRLIPVATPSNYDLGAYEYVLPNFTRFYVDISSQAGLKNGGSWATAYSSLEQALADPYLETGDSIWVAKGTYQPSATNAAFKMKEGVKIYGGFLNTASDFSERDYKTNETILGGNGGRVIGNLFSELDSLSRNSLLDGFTISGGRGLGGGIYNQYASPVLRNLVVKNNTGSSGAGIRLAFSNSLIENVRIENNTGTGSGAGLYIRSGSNVVVKNVVISNNTANGTGGGLDISGASAKLTNVVISENKSLTSGGGIHSANDASQLQLNNVVFYKNTAAKGAGFAARGPNYSGVVSNVSFVNSTFTENAATDTGGGILYEHDAINTNISIINTVFWDNTAAISGSSDLSATAPYTIDYSFSKESQGTNTTGNILGTSSPFLLQANPKGLDGLWFTADDGLQPAKASPIINTGSNVAATDISTDFTSRSRIFGAAIDMGAYEAYPSSDATLSALAISEGTLDTAFNANDTAYEVAVANSVETITLTASFNEATASVVINNEPAVNLTSGTASLPLALPIGSNEINIIVKAADSTTVKTYTINVVRAKTVQVINPIAAIEKTYGDADFEPGATSNSPSAINYSSADTTIAQTYQDSLDNLKWKIKIIKTGTVAITANQPGDVFSLPADPVVFELKINKGIATLVLDSLSTTYNGTAKAATIATNPTGLSGITITYDGLATVPVAAGNYAVVATLVNDNYTASNVSDTLRISKATATLAFSNLDPTYDGTAKAAMVTTSPAALSGVTVTYDGQSTAPSEAGTYVVVARLNNANYTATDLTDALVVGKAVATFALANLNQTYNGTARPVTVTSNPVGLAVSITYDGSSTEPTAAGTYAVVASLNDNNYTGADVTGNLVIAKAVAGLTFSNLNASYDGTAKAATVTTNPAGLAGVSITYDGSTEAPTAAGTYEVVAKLSNANYTALETSGNLVIAKGIATLMVPNGSVNYNGEAKVWNVSTNPPNLTGVSLTYNGESSAPVNAGTYEVEATLNNTNFSAVSARGTMVINKAGAIFSLNGLRSDYDGNPRSNTVTISPSGLSGVTVTYSGQTTAPVNAGSYTVLATLNNINYEADDATATLIIDKADATITLSGLAAAYDGTAKSASATTNPAGLSGISITYDGSSAAPTAAGSYAVVASLTNANYTATSAIGTLTIAKG
ncbi:MAG: hypothetical protein EOP54_14240, partial [Sphingobacteriales bacterium]